MKKVFVILLTLTLLLGMSALAMAADPDTPVSSGVEGDSVKIEDTNEGRTDITALTVPDAGASAEVKPNSPDTAEDVDYVGRDLVLEEGEAGITSVVEDDIASVVGDDIEIGEGEFKIISYTPEQPDQNALNYLIFGILLLATSVIVFIARRAAHNRV